MAVARAALPTLPRRARYAVGATLAMYQAWSRARDAAPEALLTGRVRLPTPVKLLVVGGSRAGEVRGREVDA